MSLEQYFSALSQIVSQVQEIENRNVSIYIHCSKLNDLLSAIRQIPPCIETEQATCKKHKFRTKEVNSISNINASLVRVNELLTQCLLETCAQFLINKPIKTTRKEIGHIRETLSSSFDQLKIPALAQAMKITRPELKSQDMVDMKRISIILVQLTRKNRSDVNERLQERFKSLKKIGITVDLNERTFLTVPELPSNLQLVIRHEDVKLGREIGKGQSGSVHIGELNGKEVAVKVLHRRALSPTELDSYQKEIYVLANLSHPALLKMHGFTEEPPFLLVMEYMQNGSLFSVLRRRPETLNATARSLIAMDVARGLEFLHGRGVIHRDMKSLNVLLDEKNHAKLGDFGMVRVKEKGVKTGMVGTVHWMAPEVLMSSPTYDNKVDVYSYGIFLWELLTNELPYKELKSSDIITSVVNNNLRPIIPDGTPPQLALLIKKCWDRDPAQRPSMTRIIADLSEKEFHFQGTDEVIFATEAGVVNRHKVSASVEVSHKRGRKPDKGSELMDLVDPVTIVQTIRELHGSSRTSLLGALFEVINDKMEMESALHAGACSLIAEILDEHSSSSEYVLTRLLKCGPRVFDVVVLKALLSYAVLDNEALRSKALSALIVATEKRFDFLSSAPSFLVQIFGFLSKPIQPQLQNSLIQTGKKLLASFDHIPETITSQLLWARTHLTPILIPSIVSCLSVALKSDNGKKEFQMESMTDMIHDFPLYRPALEAYASGEKSCSKDQFFISLVFGARQNPDIFNFLVTLASNPRFSMLIADLLPIGGKTKEVANVYRPLLAQRDLVPILSKLAEFYACASFFVANCEYELICNALKYCNIDSAIVSHSKLCSLVVTAFNNAQNDEQIVLLMAAVYCISKAVYAPEFEMILPRLYAMLFSSNYAIMMPAFLSIVAIGMHREIRVDYDKIMPFAARFVNCDSAMTRDLAAGVIRDHVEEARENLPQVLSAFVESYRDHDPENAKIAINAFVVACKKSPNVDSSIRQKLSHIYAQLYPRC